MRKRRKWGAVEKAQVALAAIREQMTMAEICSKYEIHTSQVSRWRKEALEGLAEIFSQEKGESGSVSSSLVDELYKQIGQLKVENEWLKKKSTIFGS